MAASAITSSFDVGISVGLGVVDQKATLIPDGEPAAAFNDRAAAAEDGERVWGPGVEPIYCYCMEPYDEEKKPNMIQCSGEGCEFNWFLWKECWGIKRQPPATRDWYCPSCALGRA